MKNKQRNVFDKKLEKACFSTLKFTFRVLKKMIINVSMIHLAILNKERYLLLATIIAINIYLVSINSEIKYHLLSPLFYFFLKSLYQDFKEKAFNKKYKGIYSLFDGKVKVIAVNKDKSVFNLYSYIPVFEIEKKLPQIEHYLNLQITKLKRDPKNFRKITIETEKYISEDNIRMDKIYYLDEYLPKIKRNKNFDIQFVAGIDEKGKVLIYDLVDLIHTFIAGTSGGGKSCLLNVIIQSLMYFNNNIFFIMADFKEFIELNQYSKFKNVASAQKQEVFLDKLKELDKEMKERYTKIKNDNCKKIQQYNQKNKNKIPYIVVIIDEMSDIKLNKKSSEEIEILLKQIMNKGRAAGIFVIGCTQRPAGTQLDTDIRDRFDTKISGRIKDTNSQRMAGIKGTEKLKKGEFFIETDEQKKKFKGFYIDDVKSNNVYYMLQNLYEWRVKLEKNIQ